MFGLTQREQRWKAEQKAAETLVGLTVAVLQTKAQIAQTEALTEERIRQIVRDEMARMASDPQRGSEGA